MHSSPDGKPRFGRHQIGGEFCLGHEVLHRAAAFDHHAHGPQAGRGPVGPPHRTRGTSLSGVRWATVPIQRTLDRDIVGHQELLDGMAIGGLGHAIDPVAARSPAPASATSHRPGAIPHVTPSPFRSRRSACPEAGGRVCGRPPPSSPSWLRPAGRETAGRLGCVTRR